MAADIEINGVDPSTYGFTATNGTDLLSGPPLTFSPIALPHRPGARVGLRTTGSRPFTIAGVLSSTSLSAAESNVDGLMHLCLQEQPTTVIFAWDTGRRLSAECERVQVNSKGGMFGLFVYDVSIQFAAPDPPFWEAASQTLVIVSGTSAGEIAQGTAPTWPQLQVPGPATNPTITLRDSTGGSQGTIGFTVTVPSAQYLSIDMDTMTAYLADSPGTFNSGTSVLDDWTSGDFFYVQQSYSNYAASSWATIECGTTEGGGVRAYYYKAWY